MVNPPPIRALTAKTKAGVTYQRRPEVQAEIAALLALTTNELIARLTVSNEKDSQFVRPESLVYFVRDFWGSANVTSVVDSLLRRIARQLRRSLQYLAQDRNDVSQEVSKQLVDWFRTNNERLDYYEVNFNGALRALVVDTIRKTRDETESVVADPWKLRAEQKAALGFKDDALDEAWREVYSQGIADPAEVYERKADLSAAMAMLICIEPKVREAWILHVLDGLPFESNNPEQESVSKKQNCSEKTARTRVAKAEELITRWRENPND